MKTPLEEAKAFVRLVEGLNSVPGMMSTHDEGKLRLCRALIAAENVIARADMDTIGDLRKENAALICENEAMKDAPGIVRENRLLVLLVELLAAQRGV